MAAKEKDEKEEVLEPVGPGAAEDFGGEIVRDTEGRSPDDRDDERDHEGEDETDRQADERAGHAEGDDEEGDGEDREHIRSRRRAERRRKKEDQQRKNRELDFLRQRNETLERRQSEIDLRMSNTEVITLDGNIRQVEADIRKADDVYAEAISKGDGASAAEAQRIRDTLRDGLSGMQRQKEQIINGARQRASAPRPDPEIQRRAQDWVAANPWYDPQLKDEDSTIARVIEERLAKEMGLTSARTDAYWEEYNRRLKKRLPHLFKNRDRDRDEEDEDDRDDEDEGRDDRRADRDDDRPRARDRDRDDDRDDPPRKRNGGPRFASGGRERPLKKNEVYVSAERRQAMIEAGVWDDIPTRNRYLKQYQKYDSEARRNRR